MKKFWIAIHHPENYDPTAAEDDVMRREIDQLNDEMVAAGVMVFVGGLQPVGKAKSLRRQADGSVCVHDGPLLRTTEHVGGFWVLEVADLEAALAWGEKAAGLAGK